MGKVRILANALNVFTILKTEVLKTMTQLTRLASQKELFASTGQKWFYGVNIEQAPSSAEASNFMCNISALDVQQ